MRPNVTPKDKEIVMRSEDFIVTKTDTRGKLTYCNATFIEFSGYQESEMLGQPHNWVRHPDMPRAVFALLWQTISAGDEFFGYVKNLCKDGSYYWVFATVTPSFRPGTQEIVGYFSVRRKPERDKLDVIEPLYRQMCQAEKQVDRTQAVAEGQAILKQKLAETGKSYREFILTL